MGILSGLLDILRKIWDFIKKFWWLIALVLLVIFIWFPATWALISGFFSSLWASIGAFAAWIPGGWGSVAAIGFGVLAVLDPEDAEKVGEEIANGIDKVIDIGTDVITGTIGSFLSNPLVLAAGAVAIWWFFIRDKDGEDTDPGEPYPVESSV